MALYEGTAIRGSWKHPQSIDAVNGGSMADEAPNTYLHVSWLTLSDDKGNTSQSADVDGTIVVQLCNLRNLCERGSKNAVGSGWDM